MFGWREVWLTRSMEDMQRVCAILDQHGIDHRVRGDSGGLLNSGRHRGVPNIRMDCAYEYRICVPRKEAEWAKHLLRR